MGFKNEVDVEAYINLLYRYDVKFGLLAYLGIHTGLRLSDLLKLKFEAFGAHLGVLEIKEEKTKKMRRVEITGMMRTKVWAYQTGRGLKDTDYLFYGRRRDRPMHRSTAYRRLRRAGEQLGFKRIGAHSMRKTYAMKLFKESGGDLEYVSKCMNHKYSETTLRHYLMSGVTTEQILRLIVGEF